MAAAGIGAALGAFALGACSSAPMSSQSGDGGQPPDGGVCPAKVAAPAVLPHVTEAHRSAAYWIALADDADRVILSAEAVTHHNAALAAHDRAHPADDPLARYDLGAPEDPRRLERDLEERLAYLRERLEDGTYVDAAGKPLSPAEQAPFGKPATVASPGQAVHWAEADTPLRCGPRDAPLFKGPVVDPAFDRNSCSTVRKGELVRVIQRWEGGMSLVRTRYALGWLGPDAKLSAPLSADALASALVARSAPLTRRALLEKAFSLLDQPYGWGGQNGGRDCSRFVMDVFESFGLELPRHSGLQAKAGSMAIDLSTVQASEERLSLIDGAHRRGAVLLHFPGHIMLYLGRSQEGTPMAIHAFAEYLEACPGGGESLRVVDRIQVSDLSLGRGTSRRSFLERITGVTILGEVPGVELQGAVTRRTAAPMATASPALCKDSPEVALVTSPRRPHVGAPLRVIVSSPRDLGSAQIVLTDPSGQQHVPTMHTLGGPPYGYWVDLAAPAAGTYTAQIGDGGRLDACARVTVHDKGDKRQASGGAVWLPRLAWTEATENLFANFIEQLFDYPLDDRTWDNLQDLLGNRDKNLLYDHLGQGEDDTLSLSPDCADLPYFLRAYFAWKLRLPFAYRHCNRGFKGKAPYCDRELHDQLTGVEASTEVGAFALFARDKVANGVHSGSGRAEVDTDHSDYYPIALTREAIRPGTIFADPYGHLYMIADWVPQGVGTYGILVGADAQPDGTIARRRFWPGTFLFSPETKEFAAGFKAFRTAVYRGGRTRQLKNGELPGYSKEQYQGSVHDFYDKVEALINPRPLDPEAMLEVLVTALHEQAKGRVLSVQNAVDYLASRGGAIDMPSGHSIFETTGAWEDYSTPSRDMRLLIALDTVLGFPDAVKRNPARFGIAGGADATVAALRTTLEASLGAHRFSYKNSAGQAVELSLKDLVVRMKALEMAYNPNDCVEIRWAAPEGSPERSTCRRHAPQHQLAKMAQYRAWFASRKRPAR